jgi:Fe-S cluster assembly protein SufD
MTGPAAEAAERSAAEAAEAPAAGRSREARRGPADLPFDFADATLVERLVAERDEPAWLAADRRSAMERFAALPVEANRLYTTYVDLRSADLFAARPYSLTEAAAAGGGANLPDGVDGLLELREDGVVAAALAPGLAERGVSLETLGAALARDADGVREALSRTALPDDDKLAWLSRASWSQGIHVHVPAGVRLERPIVLRWATGAPERALLGRTIVRLDQGAEASVLEELVPAGPAIACAAGEPVPQALFGSTTEISLGRGALLRLASIQDLAAGTVAFQQRTARVGEAATLRLAIAQLGTGLVRSRIDNRLEGDGSSVEQVEIVFGGPGQLFDLTSYTRHIGRDTTGTLLSKAVLAGGARAYMKGLISIERSARGTDSFLGEFGMLLDRRSRSVTIPSLEIDQPDCRRAGHSSSVGPIDPAQVFYLMSRGISEDDARRVITLGFLEPVVARVPLEEERDRLWTMLEAKWAESRGGAAAA